MLIIQKNNKLLLNDKGMTLIELLAVVVILAIIAAIAIPTFGNVIDNSRYKAVKSDAINVINAAQLYYIDNPDEIGPVQVEVLVEKGFLKHAGTLTSIDEGDGVAKTKPLSFTGKGNFSDKTVTFIKATVNTIDGDKKKAKDITTSTAHIIDETEETN